MSSADLKSLFGKYPGNSRGLLIPILQDIQELVGYIPDEAVTALAEHLKIPPVKIYSVATYYNQFSFEKPGKFHLQICTGAGCHLEKGTQIQKEIYKLLEIRDGEMTKDGMFSLELVPCLGACHEAPVLAVNGKLYGNLSLRELSKLIDKLQSES